MSANETEQAMRFHPHITVGEIAAMIPHVTKLFDVIGIDYVLHGNLSLRDACAEAGIDAATVRKSIESMPQPEEETSWADAPMQELLEEVRDRRHPKMRALLSATATMLADMKSHEPVLATLREHFGQLCDAVQPHMTREEHMLFPVIQHLEDCWTKSEHLSMNFVGGLEKPMATLIEDHGTIVSRLREVGGDAKLLTENGPEITRLRAAIEELDHEVREHIHLENNVLYPRAAAVEAAVKA